MIIYDLLFYVFATLVVIASLSVISVKNPVYSVLFLIFAFFNAAGLFETFLQSKPVTTEAINGNNKTYIIIG